jgi:hypothetical protein
MPKVEKISKRNKKFNISTYHNLGINFFGIPKCGNSTVKYSLHKANDPEKEIKAIHDYKNSEYLTKSEALSNGYTNFTVLRNPHARMVSSYKHFILNKKSNKNFGHKKLQELMIEKNYSMSLDEFVDLICAYKDGDINMHFSSQHSFVSHSFFKLGPIDISTAMPIIKLKLENIKETIQIANQTIPIINKNVSKVGHDLSVKDLSDKSKKLIEKRYAKDFDLWEKAT